MIFLPDTNILIDALNGRRNQKSLLTNLILQGHRLSCCAVTISELFSGVHPADVPKVEQFVGAFSWYPTTPAIARLAGRWRHEYARQGLKLALADSLIAATAVENSLRLITNNKKHFPMSELSIYSGT